MTMDSSNEEGGGRGTRAVSATYSDGEKRALNMYGGMKPFDIEPFLRDSFFPEFFKKMVRESLHSLLTENKFWSSRDIANRLHALGNQADRNSTPELTEMQKYFNDHIWICDAKGKLNGIMSKHFLPMFAPGKEADWPNLVLTSNHARAGSSDDLSDLLKCMEQFTHDAWGKLDICRPINGRAMTGTKGKTIVALACHTESNVLHNGAELLDRRCSLEEDPNKDNPALRTLDHMSPAAMRLAKLMLKLMVEPEPPKPGQLSRINLDIATRAHQHRPFIAQATDRPLVLRADAARIAQHIKLIGYSRGANTVTDALRFLYRECAMLGTQLQARGVDGQIHAATAEDIKTLISNIGLLSIAPGEVPLTKAEKEIVGIKRVTILNKFDLTAGHLVNPSAKEYDRWADRLIKIEGTTAENGHSIKEALGFEGVPGYIMNPANREKANYAIAQDEVKAYWASNYHKQAISTLCFSPEGPDNVLYVQFAPGVGRGQEHKAEQKLLDALAAQGFDQATAQSDLGDRRRIRIVLDHDAQKKPILIYRGTTLVAANKEKIGHCRDAFASISAANNGLFVTEDVKQYLEHELKPAKAPPGLPFRRKVSEDVAGNGGHARIR